MAKKNHLRTDVILTDAEQDMIDFIVNSGIPRATLFKTAMRAYMNRKEEEQFDERVKRLLKETLSEGGFKAPATIDKVENKNRLAFGSKKVNIDD